MARAWETDRGRLVAEAARIDAALRDEPAPGSVPVPGPAPADAADAAVLDASVPGAGAPQPGVPDAQLLAAAVTALAGDFDAAHPGFGRAPKFPPSTVLGLLADVADTGGPGAGEAAGMAGATLAAMAAGGIHDQLAGGFARYAVDRAWTVPHFEKMLYDNALLLRAYTRWAVGPGRDGPAREPSGELTADDRQGPRDAGPGPGPGPIGRPGSAIGRADAERVARGIAAFLLTDLRTDQGGFAASLDADTSVDGPDGVHGVEGATYVWTPAQLAGVLGAEDGAWAATVFGVTGAGTFEHGTSTLRLPAGPPADTDRFERVRAALLAARRDRPQPARDDKVVTAWNALALESLVRAGESFGEPSWTAAAAEAADLVLRANRDPGGRLLRTSRDGVPGSADAVLEDVAALASALLTLAGATGDRRWAREAAGLVADLDRFADGTGGWWDTAADSHAAGGLPRRPRDPLDGPSPSGAHLAAAALAAAAALTGSDALRTAAAASLRPAAELATRAPRAVAAGLSVAAGLAAGPVQVAVVGAVGDPARSALARTAWRLAPPGAVVAVGDPADAVPVFPLLAGRGLVDGQAAAYVCRGFTCRLPVRTPAELAAQLATA